jgi:N-acetylmuramoyl-L-alanine amidase
MKRTCLCLLPLVAVVGCAPGLRIDHSYQARSQDSRVQFLILHFTNEDYSSSLRILTEGSVSSHYLVRDEPVEIYQLVPEGRRAYHAGLSSWKGQTMLNAASIGIEIVNRGDYKGPDGSLYPDYPKAQIDAVIQLVKQIVARHGIRPDRILGHSDIAPLRKVDPGPKFPWKRFADEGLIPWPDAAAVAAKTAGYEQALPDVAWFQAKLAEHGFEVPRTGALDEPTRKVVAAFQMKYRPERYDGQPDAETAAILAVLTATAK